MPVSNVAHAEWNQPAKAIETDRSIRLNGTRELLPMHTTFQTRWDIISIEKDSEGQLWGNIVIGIHLDNDTLWPWCSRQIKVAITLREEFVHEMVTYSDGEQLHLVMNAMKTAIRFHMIRENGLRECLFRMIDKGRISTDKMLRAIPKKLTLPLKHRRKHGRKKTT